MDILHLPSPRPSPTGEGESYFPKNAIIRLRGTLSSKANLAAILRAISVYISLILP